MTRSRPVRRATVAGTLALSCVAGAAGGTALHARWPDPFDRATGAPAQNAARRTPSPSPSTAGPTPTPSPGTTPSPGPSTTSGPSTAAGAAPAFTHLALLQPRELVTHGWQVAHRVDAYPGPPPAAITPCTTVPPDAAGLVAGFAATYASHRTTAAEVVARFDSTARAEAAYADLRGAIESCVDAPPPLERRRVTGVHHPVAEEVSELRWWNTRSPDLTSDRGVIGIVRVDDRVALLSLDSSDRDPAGTTRIDGLLTLAGRRLV